MVVSRVYHCANAGDPETLVKALGPRGLALSLATSEHRGRMGFSIGNVFKRWFRKPKDQEGTVEPPLRPGEAAEKGRPGVEPPLEPGEAAFKDRPGVEPPLEPGEAAFKDPSAEPPLRGDEPRAD